MNLTEAQAIRPSISQFDGKPCVRCGGICRYVTNNRCVACVRRSGMSRVQIAEQTAARRAIRAAASLAGKPTYIGHDCDHGHGGERSSVTGYCVACRKVSQSKRNENLRKPKRAKAVVALPVAKPPATKPMVVWANPTPMEVWISCITPPTKAMLMGRR